MSDLGWLAAGFGVTWLVIGLYLMRLWRVQRAIDRRLEQLAARSGENSPSDLS